MGEMMSEQVTPEIEMLARMWMECDPNRSGSDPDSTITMRDPIRSVPAWHWFIPRAIASQKYMASQGYALSPLDVIWTSSEERIDAELMALGIDPQVAVDSVRKLISNVISSLPSHQPLNQTE